MKKTLLFGVMEKRRRVKAVLDMVSALTGDRLFLIRFNRGGRIWRALGGAALLP
jgi:hypothetical protein